MVYPTNVLYLSTVSANKDHCAAFPESLPAWFIKLFTKEGDIVLDPFLGSGTTAIVAKKLGRRYIGIDTDKKNIILASEKILKAKLNMELFCTTEYRETEPIRVVD